MWTKHLLFLIILLTIVCVIDLKKITKNVYFSSRTISFNPLYIQEHLLTIGPDHLSLNIVLNIAQNFTHDPWVVISLASKNRKLNNYRPLFMYDINACTILGKEGSQLNNFALNWANNFWKYGNLPKSCPILKGNYTWTGLKADKLNIPSFLPNGMYRIIVNTYFRKDTLNKESIANITVLAVLK